MFAKLALFRIRLYLILGLVALLSLILASAAYSLAGKSRHYLERSHLSREVHSEYVTLTLETYRLFKQLMDILISEGKNEPVDTRISKTAIGENLDRLRLLHASEIAHVDDDETVEEKSELIVLAQAEALINKVLVDLERVGTLRATGRMDESLRSLIHTLENRIDVEFAGLVRTALEREYEEVGDATRESDSLMRRHNRITGVISTLIVMLSVWFVYVARLRLRRPLEILSDATEQLKRGNLAHRVSIPGRDEFAAMGRQFNAMADALLAKQRRLKSGKDELEQTAEFRTEDLRIAREKLNRVDVNRRQFFADISHELRTPLTLIKGESQIALRGQDKSIGEYKDSLRRIGEQADQLNRLVDDLLFIARANADSVNLKRKTVVLDSLLEGVCADVGVIARGKHLDVQFHNQMPGAKLTGDDEKLRQLFMILLMNAIGYSSSNSEITITLHEGTEGAIIKVIDRGMGIPEADIENIFERFYRGKNVKVSEIPGSGLGLPVARAIVVAHDGSIQVDSEVGAGTTVTVALPIAKKMHAVA